MNHGRHSLGWNWCWDELTCPPNAFRASLQMWGLLYGRYSWVLLALKVFPYVDLFQLYFSEADFVSCLSKWKVTVFMAFWDSDKRCHECRNEMSFSPLLKSWIHKETLNTGYIDWETNVPWQTADKEVLNVIQITVVKWPMLFSQQLKESDGRQSLLN